MKQILPWSLSLIITYLILSRAYLFQLGMEVDLPSKHREQSVVTQGMAPPPPPPPPPQIPKCLQLLIPDAFLVLPPLLGEEGSQFNQVSSAHSWNGNGRRNGREKAKERRTNGRNNYQIGKAERIVT